MISIKEYILLLVLLLIYLSHMSNALQCKTCEKTDPACLSGRNVETRTCIKADDICYSWFDRTGSHIGTQRGCISPEMNEYKLIKSMMRNKDSDCVKRVNGLDCFKFCDLDECN